MALCGFAPDPVAQDVALVAVGALPSELVLRGGCLKEPVLLSGLRTADGAQFLVLFKGCPLLNKFLTGTPVCKRPLAKTTLIEYILAKKNSAFDAAVTEVKQGSAPIADNALAEADFASALCLDDPPAAAPRESSGPGPRNHRKLRGIGRFVAQLPSTCLVQLQRGNATWDLRVLLDGKTKAPAIEASAGNLQRLFSWVQEDLREGGRVRARYGAAQAPERTPRGCRDSREYLVRNRWVKKIRLPVIHKPTRPYARSFRTLVRQRSDEVSQPALTDGADCLAGDCL